MGVRKEGGIETSERCVGGSMCVCLREKGRERVSEKERKRACEQAKATLLAAGLHGPN